jgi:glycosyltransferase involved in cell wall biosynthesis
VFIRYLIPIHVPIYTQGNACLVATDWKRSLMLLRDSLGGRYGTITVVAPSVPSHDAGPGQVLEELDHRRDDIELVPSFDARVRARWYWARDRPRWMALLRLLMPEAAIVHGALDDVYRPIAFAGFIEGVARHLPTVFVQDTDIVLRVLEGARELPLRQRFPATAYAHLYERMRRWAICRASLSLLKSRGLAERYGSCAGRIRVYQDTSFRASDIVPFGVVEERLSARKSGTLRLVYCGRLVAGKGIDRSISLLSQAARSFNLKLTFDVIGDGPELALLRRQAEGCACSVTFHGPIPYGPELLRRLSAYDALLFTPPVEDTPRMVFDAFASGLPVIGNDIAFLTELARENGGVCLIPRHDPTGAVATMARLVRSDPELRALTCQAHRAAHEHTAERWYGRRAEWTHEMMAEHAWRRGRVRFARSAPGVSDKAPCRLPGTAPHRNVGARR